MYSSEYVFELHVCKLQVSLDVSENEITHFGRGLAACQRLQRLSARQNALCSLDDSICMLSQVGHRSSCCTCAFLLRLEAPTSMPCT